MDSPSYEQSLIAAGLTKDQANIYEILVKNGPLQASRIQRKTTISRPLTYKILGELGSLGLVEKRDEKGKVAVFIPVHPLKLKDLIERKREEAEKATVAIDGVLGNLTSDFNLVSGKPGIRFYEGRKGIQDVMNDALTSKTEIYSYVDIDAIERIIPDISREFAKARQKRSLKKKNIGIDTPENRQEINGYYPDVTEERLIPWPTASFGTVMQIYDGKVSYFTLEEPMIGVIISDPHIYEMHRSLFEFTWKHPLAYIPRKTQATARRDSDSGSSTISDVSTP